MKSSTRWIVLVSTLTLANLTSISRADDHFLPVIKPGKERQSNTQAEATQDGIEFATQFATQFARWKDEKQVAVDFLNPPNIDREGLVTVINPEYQFEGKRFTEVVEDGVWYHDALVSARGAILFGRGNGRSPWSYKIGELYVENDKLKLRHRISFGSNKGARTRLLIDLNDEPVVGKIGVAIEEMVPGSPWGYPGITVDELVITSEEVEQTPVVPLKPNWIQVDIDFRPVETFRKPVRVIWLQFQDDGRRLVRIDN